MLEKSRDLSEKLAICIHACNDCLFSCLEEEDVKMMTECIKLDKDCSVLCSATLQLVHKNGKFVEEILALCEKACNACADECRKHPQEHCQECAKACDDCAQACRKFMF